MCRSVYHVKGGETHPYSPGLTSTVKESFGYWDREESPTTTDLYPFSVHQCLPGTHFVIDVGERTAEGFRSVVCPDVFFSRSWRTLTVGVGGSGWSDTTGHYGVRLWAQGSSVRGSDLSVVDGPATGSRRSRAARRSRKQTCSVEVVDVPFNYSYRTLSLHWCRIRFSCVNKIK